MLDGRRVEIGAKLRQQPFPLVPIVLEHADLHELVGSEAHVDFMQHRRREPVRADAHHGMEVMCFRAERTPLGRC